MPLAIGTLLKDRYRIVHILGQGGMGAVYRASDEHLQIPVAVKENLFLTEEYGRQFQREARILAGLRHPNLPHVSDYFALEHQGQYLVMDYIDGEDLRQRMERMGPLPEREAILIGISICDALTYLHSRRLPIVHRDIKPGNIKVTPDGQAVLVDFGLAKVMEGGQVTSTGARAMTPGYSPPEQYGTARTDPRSDIYSHGATLYAALTGVIPEDGLARMTGKTKLTPIRDLMPKANRKLAETIEHALEIDPDDRYQTAEEFKHSLIESGELATFYQERPSIPPPPAVSPNGEAGAVINDDLGDVGAPKINDRRPSRRRKKRIGWAAIPVVVLLAAGMYLLLTFRPDLARTVFGYFGASPVATNPPTQIASINTRQPTSTSPLPTQTIAATQPEKTAAQLTSTPEAAQAQSPSLTPAAAMIPTVGATPIGGGIGQIAFSSDRSGVMQVWLIDVSTKKAHQVTNAKDGACQPDWAPDGMRLAYISPCPDKQDDYPGSNIYSINLDLSGNPDQNSIKQITSSLEGDFDPAWAPDGKRIAFTSLRKGKSSIWIINLDDNSLQQLSRFQYPDKQPAWAPSGMQLAFVRQRVNSQIWVMSDNGEIESQFSLMPGVNNVWPTWSADGQIIFYSQTSISPDSNVPGLVYKRYENRKDALETRIPTNARSDIGPIAEVHPSPDGYWLAFESWPNGDNHDIYIMNVNGSNQQRLTTDPGFDFWPVWRPMINAAPQP